MSLLRSLTNLHFISSINISLLWSLRKIRLTFCYKHNAESSETITNGNWIQKHNRREYHLYLWSARLTFLVPTITIWHKYLRSNILEGCPINQKELKWEEREERFGQQGQARNIRNNKSMTMRMSIATWVSCEANCGFFGDISTCKKNPPRITKGVRC